MSFSRTSKTYRVAKSTAAGALGVADVQDWEWDGGNLLVVHSSTVIPNTPIPGVDRLDVPRTGFPWEDIRIQFFGAIPPSVFERMTVSFDGSNIYFDLNREDL